MLLEIHIVSTIKLLIYLIQLYSVGMQYSFRGGRDFRNQPLMNILQLLFRVANVKNQPPGCEKRELTDA